DYELEFARQRDRQVTGLGAFENLTDIESDLAMHIDDVDAVAHQTAGRRVLAKMIHCRHRMARRQLHDPGALGVEAAAPPSSVMNSRRLIQSPRRRVAGEGKARRGREP